MVAGRTAQEYNLRKKRKGAFWEDRYHATAVESEKHLFQCLAYIDLNMVRTGVISHPSDYDFGGYNEIQKPRRKSILIDYQKLAELTGYKSYKNFQDAHRDLINASLANSNNSRQPQWTESIAVGSKSFIETFQGKLGARAKGRKSLESEGGFQLRENLATYIDDFDSINGNIGAQNTYYWNVNI